MNRRWKYLMWAGLPFIRGVGKTNLRYDPVTSRGFSPPSPGGHNPRTGLPVSHKRRKGWKRVRRPRHLKHQFQGITNAHYVGRPVREGAR